MPYIQKAVHFHAQSVSELASQIEEREMFVETADERPIIAISIVQDHEGGYSCIGLTEAVEKDWHP